MVFPVSETGARPLNPLHQVLPGLQDRSRVIGVFLHEFQCLLDDLNGLVSVFTWRGFENTIKTMSSLIKSDQGRRNGGLFLTGRPSGRRKSAALTVKNFVDQTTKFSLD